jgi:hypothetical protein
MAAADGVLAFVESDRVAAALMVAVVAFQPPANVRYRPRGVVAEWS